MTQLDKKPLYEDQQPPKNEPIFNLPWIIPALIGLMALIHFLRVSFVSQETAHWMIIEFAFIPARFSNAELSQFSYLTPITYSFLHADWTHLLMNSFWLLAFGGVTARRLGFLRFMILFCVGAICGAGLHYIFHAGEVSPMIGASASVSACMGAAMLLPAFSETHFKGDITKVRIRTLVEALTNRQAITFIVVWFGINLLFGTGIVDTTGNGNSIAWEAHIGGFVSGFLFFGFIDALFKKREINPN